MQVNTLLLEDLSRRDLHSILTCQASNNNLSNPVATSVKIDMHCEWTQQHYYMVKAPST